MHYERSLFSPEQQNWCDLRKSMDTPTSGEQEASYMIAWCHGAAGIGLGRLKSLQYINDATIRAEIDAAIQTTLTRGFGSNHSLCHGDMGNIELPLMAAQVLDDPKLLQTVRQLAASLLESIETQGWITGIPMGIETPGLMTGLAGTGYMLLRLAAPDRVPSVLTLAEPC
jgi:lantibiotic modifying enzyme